jgi:hypothetical protein
LFFAYFDDQPDCAEHRPDLRDVLLRGACAGSERARAFTESGRNVRHHAQEARRAGGFHAREPDAGGEGDDQFVGERGRGFLDDREDDSGFNADETGVRAADGFQVVGGDVNAGFALDGLAQFGVWFAGDDLIRRANVAQDQPAKDRAREFTRANESEAISWF